MLTFTLEKSKCLSYNVPFVGFEIYIIVVILRRFLEEYFFYV